MHPIVYLPVAVSALLGLIGPVQARRLAPATAVRLLVGAAVVVSLCWLAMLALLSLWLLARLPPVAEAGHWSVPVIVAGSPVPVAEAGLAAALLVLLTLLAGRQLISRIGAGLALARACHRHAGELVVTDDSDALAYAVPGLPALRRGRRAEGRISGHIVVSNRMLACLPDAGERRALLTHERAHLRHHHGTANTLVGLAASLNPFLGRLPAAVSLAAERWADEEAARDVGDRRVVARALGRAALATLVPAPTGLALVNTDVPDRVRALLAPAPTDRRWRVLLVVALAVAAAISVAIAYQETDRLFEAAQLVLGQQFGQQLGQH
jgi:hypothetical protein